MLTTKGNGKYGTHDVRIYYEDTDHSGVVYHVSENRLNHRKKPVTNKYNVQIGKLSTVLRARPGAPVGSR